MIEAPELSAEPLAVPGEVTALIREMGVERLIAERSKSEEWRKLNRIEQVLAEYPQQEMPLHHVFTPHLYSRSILIPADTFATTRIHLFDHPFVISAGIVSVWNDGAWERLCASHIGVTKAGTRRLLYAHTDVVWHSFHVTDETDTDKLVDILTFNPVNLGHLDSLAPEKLEALSAAAKYRMQLV